MKLIVSIESSMKSYNSLGFKVIKNCALILLLAFAHLGWGCESTKDDGLNDSLLFKDHGCLQLTSNENNFKQYSYYNPNFNFLAYQSVYIKEIIINQTPDDTVTQDVLDQMKRKIRSTLIGRIGNSRKIVSAPGPNVATLEIAFSGVTISGEGMAIIDLLPVKALWNLGKIVLDKNTKVPGLIAESKLTDSLTGKLFRARIILIRGESFVDREDAKDHFVETAKLTIDKAFKSL